ncbi:ATP synthase F0 subunit B, partial [Agathobacter rectalis]
MMNKRATKISDDIDNAEKSRAEAEKLAAQRQTELQNSHQEAAKIISTAKKTGEAQRDQIVTDAQKDAQVV